MREDPKTAFEMKMGTREQTAHTGLTAGGSVILGLGVMRVTFNDPAFFPVRWILACILCMVAALFDACYFNPKKATLCATDGMDPVSEEQPLSLEDLYARGKELKIQFELSTWAKGEFCRKLDMAVVTMGFATKERDMETAKIRLEREKEGLWEAICENEKCEERLKDVEKSLALLKRQEERTN